MLSAEFLDWWFAPWRYASSTHASQHADLVGRRDAYRLWCASLGVRPALPPVFDASWAAAVLDDSRLLTSGATLFGGLLAARQQQREVLSRLAVADRKWCMSIASGQPLAEVLDAATVRNETLEVRGLTELCCRLEHAFPGIWSRLKLLLPQELDEQVTVLAAQGHLAPGLGDAASQRALRCWRLCRRRADELHRARQPISTDDTSET